MVSLELNIRRFAEDKKTNWKPAPFVLCPFPKQELTYSLASLWLHMMVGITWDLALATQMLAKVMTSELLRICVIPPVCHRCSQYHSINVLSFDFHTWLKLIQQFAVLCQCMLAISCTSFHLSGFILFVRVFVYEVTASGCRFRTTPCIELLASLLAMGVPPGSQQSDKSFQCSVKPHQIIECRRASQQSTSRSWILQKRWWSMHGPQLVKPNFHCMIYV